MGGLSGSSSFSLHISSLTPFTFSPSASPRGENDGQSFATSSLQLVRLTHFQEWRFRAFDQRRPNGAEAGSERRRARVPSSRQQRSGFGGMN